MIVQKKLAHLMTRAENLPKKRLIHLVSGVLVASLSVGIFLGISVKLARVRALKKTATLQQQEQARRVKSLFSKTEIELTYGKP